MKKPNREEYIYPEEHHGQMLGHLDENSYIQALEDYIKFKEASEPQPSDDVIIAKMQNTVRCTITEDAEDVDENCYFIWKDVLGLSKWLRDNYQQPLPKESIEFFQDQINDLIKVNIELRKVVQQPQKIDWISQRIKQCEIQLNDPEILDKNRIEIKIELLKEIKSQLQQEDEVRECEHTPTTDKLCVKFCTKCNTILGEEY